MSKTIRLPSPLPDGTGTMSLAGRSDRSAGRLSRAGWWKSPAACALLVVVGSTPMPPSTATRVIRNAPTAATRRAYRGRGTDGTRPSLLGSGSRSMAVMLGRPARAFVEAGRNLAVRVGAAVVPSRRQDRAAGGGRLRESDRLRDRRLDDVEVVGLGDVVQHRPCVVGTSVVQRGQHAPDLELAVGEPAYVMH